MYCSKCGNEVLDEAVVCPKCGCLINETITINNGSGVRKYNNSDEISSTKRTAKAFMLLGCIVSVFGLIPLLWTIPMYCSYCRKIETVERVSTGFKICCLLFVNTIAGIIMLCDKD